MLAYSLPLSLSALASWILLRFLSQEVHGLILRASAVMFIVGCGLFNYRDPSGHFQVWGGYEVLTGIGAGIGVSSLFTFLLRVASTNNRYSVCKYPYHPGRTHFCD